MKTPRARKGRSKHGRKLGKITMETEKSLNESFGKELNEIPGHFMYNEENDAIQQVLKLPDITVSDSADSKEGNKRGLSLPPISGDDKGSYDYRKHTAGPTKLPKINTEQRNSSVVKSSWLERQDVSTISWKKALDVLENKTRDCTAKQDKRPRKDVEQYGRETTGNKP